MPRKKPDAGIPASLDSQLDSLLGNLLAQGWDDPTEQTVDREIRVAAPGVQTPPDLKVTPVVDRAPPVFEYPPLPTRDQTYSLPHVGETDPSATGMTVFAPGDYSDETDEQPRGGLLNIGLLTDLATGRRGAVEAAEAAGISPEAVHSALATALHGMDPKEIAKAMGIQAAEQQLKSGALYGAVLNELVADMMNNRMTAATKIELAKMLAKNGGVEPKEAKGTISGGGFVLNINLGAGGPQPVTIESD